MFGNFFTWSGRLALTSGPKKISQIKQSIIIQETGSTHGTLAKSKGLYRDIAQWTVSKEVTYTNLSMSWNASKN